MLATIGTRQKFKRLRKSIGLEVNREPVPKFSSVGRYPIYYLASDDMPMCADCVNSEIESIDEAIRDHATNPREHSGWRIVGFDANWDDPVCYCCHCDKRIESAYAEDV